MQEKIAAGVAHTAELSDVEREQIAVAIQSKAKDLGLRLPLSTVRGWVRSRVRVSGGFVNTVRVVCVWVYGCGVCMCVCVCGCV